MARFNEILVGRYNRFLQKFLSMKGGPPTPQLASEMMAVWPLFHGAENRYLEGWQRFGLANTFAANGAGLNNILRLNNPAGSNIIVVVEKATMSEGVGDTIFVDFSRAALGPLANTQAPLSMDNRDAPGTQISLSQGSSGAAFTPIMELFILANGNAEFILFEDQEIVLLPNSTVQIRASSLNNAMTAGVMFRQRFLEDSERT